MSDDLFVFSFVVTFYISNATDTNVIAKGNKMKRCLAYLRKSTDERSKQKNSYERQRAAIQRWAASNGYEVVEFFEEAVSGKMAIDARPVLRSALVRSTAEKLPIVMSSVDRLSRSVAIGASLLSDHKQKIVFADLGLEADRFTIHLFLALAEAERAKISSRQVEVQRIRREQGKFMGSPTIKAVQKQSIQANKARGLATVSKYSSWIRDAEQLGYSSLQEIADFMNKRGCKSPRGRTISPTFVMRMKKKMNAM